MVRLLIISLVLAMLVCGSIVYPVLAPGAEESVSLAQVSTPSPTATLEMAAPVVTEAPVEIVEHRPFEPLPTQGQLVPPSEDTNILYYTIAGDSLSMVAVRFGVDMNVITSPTPIDRKGLLNPGQLLIIPNNLEETSSSHKLLPDSEVAYSPSTIDFDVQAYVDEAGGYLSEYREYLASTGWTSGADVINRIALEYSVNPRLLLAFLEFKSGWVFGYPDPADTVAMTFPMGYVNVMKKNLYLQSAWFASMVMEGYYGWREGRRLLVTFKDGEVLRLAPQLNAGSVGMMNAFTYLYEYDQWAYLLYGEENFFDFYESMFGNPWVRAQQVEPLIPVDTVQPSKKNGLWSHSLKLPHFLKIVDLFE